MRSQVLYLYASERNVKNEPRISDAVSDMELLGSELQESATENKDADDREGGRGVGVGDEGDMGSEEREEATR
jgi:hypothetical protein